MRKFAFTKAIDSFKLQILAKVSVWDAMTLLQADKELRHFILERGPFYRKHFKHIRFRLAPERFTEDSLITSYFHVWIFEIGDEVSDNPLFITLNGIAGVKILEWPVSWQIFRGSLENFYRTQGQVTPCSEELSIELCEQKDLLLPESAKIRVPLEKLSSVFRLVRSFRLHHGSAFACTSRDKLKYGLANSFLKRFHLHVSDILHVWPGICNDDMLGTDKEEELKDVLINKLGQFSTLSTAFEERLFPKILPKLSHVRSLILACDIDDLIGKAESLIETTSYHHLAEVFLICYHPKKQIVFEDLRAKISNFQALADDLSSPGCRSLLGSYQKLRAKMPIESMIRKEEKMILGKRSEDQTPSFLLSKTFGSTIHFYAKFH